MRQGVDISEVETATKIRAKYLRALENDEFAMLPGGTYVKSFLRTYAEYLGLDAQLLVEEFRAHHEPRVEGELQTLAPPPQQRPGRERLPGAGPPPIAPGTALVGAIVLLLVVLAVIGLASGGGGGSKESKTTGGAAKKAAHPKRQAPAPPPKPSSVKLKVVPTELTYVCVDDGKGNTVFEGTITTPRTFRSKHLRLNLGRSSANLLVNGKPVKFQRTAAAVGFDFSRSGRVTPLPPGQRPCA